MSATARKFEMEPRMQAQTSLEATVNHIQEDITGLKADVKRLDTKIDAVSNSLVEHRLETAKSFGKLRDEMTNAIGTLRGEMKESIAALRDEMKDSTSALRVETKDSIAALRVEMMESFAKLRSSQTSQIAWAIGTLIAAAGVAFTMAKLFATP